MTSWRVPDSRQAPGLCCPRLAPAGMPVSRVALAQAGRPDSALHMARKGVEKSAAITHLFCRGRATARPQCLAAAATPGG